MCHTQLVTRDEFLALEINTKTLPLSSVIHMIKLQPLVTSQKGLPPDRRGHVSHQKYTVLLRVQHSSKTFPKIYFHRCVPYVSCRGCCACIFIYFEERHSP